MHDKENGTKFRMSVREILEWQQSYKVFAAKGIYEEGEGGQKEIQAALSGKSDDGTIQRLIL